MGSDAVRAAAKELLRRLAEIEAAIGVGAKETPALAAVTAAMNDCLASLAATRLWGRANEAPSSVLWGIAGHVLERGWMQNRARTKPRGYAGDYQLLGRMVRDELCEDPLGRFFDRYFQSLAAPQAVRNRSELVRNWIVDLVRQSDAPKAVVVVGSGPAFDIEQAAAALGPTERTRLMVRLLDYDPLALEDAESRLRLLPADNVQVQSGSLFRIPDRPKLAAWLDGADLLVSVGMFDYLDDHQAPRMLAEFWRRLAPGGELAVFNFSPQNTSRAYMEWIGNWYLIYRDKQDLRHLAATAGIPAELVEQGSEPLGVDLFLRARKPAK